MDRDNLIKIENGYEETDNILTITENQINYCSIPQIHKNYFEVLNYNLNLLHGIFDNNFAKQIDKTLQSNFALYFNKISSIVDCLSKENDEILSKYESILRKSEQKIRALYSDLFNLKIKNIYLENSVEILQKKEIEYKLIKEKTGVIVENGDIIYNSRKDNEIFILRQENSNLKNVVSKNEIELEEFKTKYQNDKLNYQEKINRLTYKISILKSKLHHNEQSAKIKSASHIKIKTNNEIDKSNSKTNNGKKNKNILFLNHCQSSGLLDFNNNIAKKINSINRPTKSKIPFINFNKINKTDTFNKKIYLTPRNPINDLKITNFQTFQKITGKKKLIRNNKSVGNNTLIKRSNTQNKIINNIIPKNKSKNNTTKNNNNILNKRRMNIKNELSWTQNLQINNPIISNSPLKINKIYVLNHNIKKSEKDSNSLSSDIKTGIIKRRKKLITNNINKSYDIFNSLNLNSMLRKNRSNNCFHNCKTNFIFITNKNK